MYEVGSQAESELHSKMVALAKTQEEKGALARGGSFWQLACLRARKYDSSPLPRQIDSKFDRLPTAGVQVRSRARAHAAGRLYGMARRKRHRSSVPTQTQRRS